MAGKNLLVNGKNNITARANAMADIQADMANRTTASNVNTTPNLPTPTRPTTVNLQKAQTPINTKLNNLNNATMPTGTITGNNPAFVNGQLTTQNTPSRFIGFQKPKTDLGGNLTQEGIKSLQPKGQNFNDLLKPTLYIPTEAKNVANETAKNSKEYKANEDLIKKFHYAVKNANGQLTADDIKKQFKEWNKNVDAALQLQADIRPLVQQGQFADMNQISEFYSELLPKQKQADTTKLKEQEEMNKNLTELSAKADKILSRYNTLSNNGVKVLEDYKQLSEYADYLKKNYRLVGDNITDADIINFAKESIPEVKQLVDEIQQLEMNFNLTEEDRNVLYENGFDLGDWLLQAGADIQDFTQNNQLANYLRNNSAKRSSQLKDLGFNASSANTLGNLPSKALSIGSIPVNMLGELAGGIGQVDTALERIAKQQNRNEDGSIDTNGVMRDIVMGGGGAMTVGWNTVMAIPTAIYNLANETEVGAALTDTTIGNADRGLDRLLSGKTLKGIGLDDNAIAEWYNDQDEQTQAEARKILLTAIFHKGSKGIGKLKKLGNFEINAVEKALGDLAKQKITIETNSPSFKAKVEQGLADGLMKISDDGILTDKNGNNIGKVKVRKMKTGEKVKYVVDKVLSINRAAWNARSLGELNPNALPDNRTFEEKADRWAYEKGEQAGEIYNSAKEGIENTKETLNKGAYNAGVATRDVVDTVSNVKPGEIIKNTAETVGKGVKATSDLIDNGKNAVTKGKNAVTNTISKGVNAVKETVNENIVEPYNKGRGKTNRSLNGTEISQQGTQQLKSNPTSVTDNKINGDNYTQKNTNSKPLNSVQLRTIQSYNRMNPKTADTFKERYGEDYGQFLADRGFTKSADGGNLNDMVEYKKDLLENKNELLNTVEGTFKDQAINDMIDHIVDYVVDTVDRKNEKRFKALQEKANNEGLTMSEINDMRQWYSYHVKTGFFKEQNAKGLQKATNIYDNLKDFLDKIGEERGLTSLREINKEIMKIQHIIGGVSYKMNAQGANNLFGLTDYVLGATLSNPETVALFLAKQVAKMPAVKNAVANTVVGRRGNAKNRITKESKQGEKENIKKINEEKRQQAEQKKRVEAGRQLQSDLSKSDTKALPNKGGTDGGKNILTNGKTIITDAKGNSKVKGQILEIDNRVKKSDSSSSDDTTPPSGGTPTGGTPTNNQGGTTDDTKTKKQPKKKVETKTKTTSKKSAVTDYINETPQNERGQMEEIEAEENLRNNETPQDTVDQIINEEQYLIDTKKYNPRNKNVAERKIKHETPKEKDIWTDSNGEEVTFYHGTPQGGFEEFSMDFRGKSNDRVGNGDYGRGMYFTPYKETAEGYAKSSKAESTNPEIYETKLRMENPLRLDLYKEFQRAMNKLAKEDTARGYSLLSKEHSENIDRLMKEFGLTEELYDKYEDIISSLGDNRFDVDIRGSGFDGIISEDGKEVIVPDTDQIIIQRHYSINETAQKPKNKVTAKKTEATAPKQETKPQDSGRITAPKKERQIIKNDKGENEIIYHGTNAKFDKFDKNFIGRGGGFRFTTSKGEAESYGKNVKEYNLMASNIMDFDSPEFDDLATQIIKQYTREKFGEEFYISPEAFIQDEGLRNYAQELGYDALKFSKGGDTKYIVYNEDQIIPVQKKPKAKATKTAKNKVTNPSKAKTTSLFNENEVDKGKQPEGLNPDALSLSDYREMQRLNDSEWYPLGRYLRYGEFKGYLSTKIATELVGDYDKIVADAFDPEYKEDEWIETAGTAEDMYDAYEEYLSMKDGDYSEKDLQQVLDTANGYADELVKGKTAKELIDKYRPDYDSDLKIFNRLSKKYPGLANGKIDLTGAEGRARREFANQENETAQDIDYQELAERENETPQDIDYQDLAELENETPQMVDIDEGVDATTQLVDEFNNLKPGEFKWIGDNREAGVRKTFGDANIKIPGEGDSVDIYFQPGESGDKMYINLHDTSNTGIRNTNEVLNKLDIPYRIGSEFDEKLNETRYYLENNLTHSKAYFDKNGASWLSVSKTLRGKEIVPRRNAEEQAEYNMQMEQRRAEIEAEREQDRIKAEERKAEEERQQEIDKQMKANLLRYVDIKHNDNPLGRGRTLKDLSEKNSEANNRIRYYGDDVADDAGVWQVLDVLADKNGKIREVWESDSKSSYSYEYYDEELGRNNNISGLNKTQRDYLEYRIKASQTEKRVNNHLDKIENKSLKTRVENKLNEMKKRQDDNGKTQYGTDAQYIDYLVLDKGFTPKEFPTGKTYANGEPKIDYMIVNEKNVGYISSKIENDYARSLLETPEEALSAEDETKLDELFTPKTTIEDEEKPILKDKDGDNLTVYHASKTDFDKFDLKKSGWNGSSFGNGFYFSNEPITEYGNPKSYNLRMSNPYEIKDVNDLNEVKKYLSLFGISEKSAETWYNWYGKDGKGAIGKALKEELGDGREVSEILKEKGYDGVIVRNSEMGINEKVKGDEYAVFDNEQIIPLKNQTTTEVTGEKNAVTAKQVENEKPKNLVTSRIEDTKQEIQEIDKDTYFDDIVKNLKDHPREMFIYKDGNYFYPHYILPSGKVITPENTYWGEVSSEEAARNWLLKEAEEHSEENETKKAEKLKEIVGKTAEKYEATLKRIESDNPMQEIWTSGDYFKYGMGNNQMARAKKESEANAEVGTFKKDVIDGKEGYRIFVAGTKNEAIRAFYEPKTGKTYRIYRGPIIDDSKPYTTKQVERIEKFLQNVDKQLDKETKKEKKEEKQVITQEWLDSLKPDKDGIIELDYKGDERWALGKGKETLIKEGKADGKYLYNYGGAAHPQYMALYIKNGIVYEGRKGLEDQYMTTKQEAVDWLNQKEKDVEHESTERYTQTDYETLPKTISVETEAEKAGPKRIAPDRVKRQQETYDQGLESVKNVLKQSPVKIYELGFKSDRSKAVQNILEERKRIRQLPETQAEPQWNELAKSVYEDLVIKDISKGYRYPEDVTSKFPKAQMKKAVDARARYEKGLFTSFSAKDTRANNQYRDEIGAGIKSQDGKPVTQEQMNEIVDGIRAYSNIFGVDMKKFAEDNNVIYVHLHGGNPFLMGGMSIAGLYRRDAAGNISVSLGGREGVMEKGEDGKMKKSDIKTTTVHEITHAVDGMLEGKLFSDADTEILKKTMNKPSELINYYNRKQEIVARAVEQYAAHQLGKKLYRTALANIDWENGSVEFVEKEANYVDREAYWNQENFDKYVKPIVEKNMKEKMKDYMLENTRKNVLANDKNKITSK